MADKSITVRINQWNVAKNSWSNPEFDHYLSMYDNFTWLKLTSRAAHTDLVWHSNIQDRCAIGLRVKLLQLAWLSLSRVQQTSWHASVPPCLHRVQPAWQHRGICMLQSLHDPLLRSNNRVQYNRNLKKKNYENLIWKYNVTEWLVQKHKLKQFLISIKIHLVRQSWIWQG